MSYYDNPQWSASAQNNWEHQGSTTPVRAGTDGMRTPSDPRMPINSLIRSGASGPQPQDDYAFSYQFDGMFSINNVGLVPSGFCWPLRGGRFVVGWSDPNQKLERTRT